MLTFDATLICKIFFRDRKIVRNIFLSVLIEKTQFFGIVCIFNMNTEKADTSFDSSIVIKYSPSIRNINEKYINKDTKCDKMFETVFLVNECANKWINITRGIMKIKHLAQNFISVDKNLIKQENPCVSQTNCVERVWKIWIFIQVKNEYSRERETARRLFRKN